MFFLASLDGVRFAMSPLQRLIACHLGRVPYEPTWTLQQHIQARLIEAKRQTPAASVPHVLLLVEHPPVYTLGKSGDLDHLLLSEDELAARGASFFHIDRGGDITFHGPGQLVGYPLLDLDRIFTDLGRYLRTLEEVIIRACADYGLTAGRVDGRTGTWIGPDARGPERKICAMGVRCSRWVTMHGFAFNLNTDLDFFGHIVPCGIADRGVTSLAHELDRPIDEAEATAHVVHHFATLFDVDLTVLHGADARAFLHDLTGEPVPASVPTSSEKPIAGH